MQQQSLFFWQLAITMYVHITTTAYLDGDTSEAFLFAIHWDLIFSSTEQISSLLLQLTNNEVEKER